MIDADLMAAWRERLAAWRASEECTAWKERRAGRETMRAEIQPFVERFARGEIDLIEFHATVRDRIRGDWDFFGTGGLTPCAQFLGKLLDRLADADALADILREVLPAPGSMAQARDRIHSLAEFVEQAITAGDVERNDIQPRRIILFLSAKSRTGQICTGGRGAGAGYGASYLADRAGEQRAPVARAPRAWNRRHRLERAR